MGYRLEVKKGMVIDTIPFCLYLAYIRKRSVNSKSHNCSQQPHLTSAHQRP